MHACRSGRLLIAACLLVVATLAARADVPGHDIPGGHDSPIVSRFAGSTMIGYHVSNFDQITLPAGKFIDAKHTFAQTESLAGKVTRIAYAAPAGKSAFEVFRNYQTALASAGFVTRFQCANQSCGDNNFDLANTLVSSSVNDSMTPGVDANYQNSIIDTLWCNDGQFHLLTAHLDRPTGHVDLSLMVCGNPGKRVGTYLQIVEAKPMATREVTVNAKAMGQGLAQKGHIALYGIQFATDSARLTTDSDATLAQMVKLMKSQPQLKVYIVGHTDNTGTLAHNLTLSQQRADAVVKALQARGVGASRMLAKGVASFAPVATNGTAAGRAQNRRVELVQQ